MTFTVSDGSLSDAETITITVGEVNAAPALNAIGNKAVAELTALAFAVSGTDADVPEQALTYSASGLPAGATFDPATGQFNWTPAEDQGPGSYDVTFTVSDGNLSDAETITITVGEVNAAPALNAIGNKAVAELTALAFTVSGTDADVPEQSLTYSASGLPAGATFDPATGQFSWTPAEDQGPGSYDVTFTVSDGSLSDAETITITVGEVNAAPALNAIGNKTVKELTELTFAAAATDADLPANALTYRLVNAPAGATIDAATGVFTWTPIEGQGPADYVFTIEVTDNGSPILSDEEQITVTVSPSVWKYFDVALSDSHTYGTVSGTFSATHQAGGGVQSVTEELYDKSRRTRLEHAWTFDVTGGDAGVSFHLLAGHNSTKETFRFEYNAKDGLGWHALLTLTGGTLTSYSAALPSSLSGPILVRVVDTDRLLNEKVIDTVTIDQMYMESRRSTPLPPAIAVRASDPAAAETGPNAGAFLIELVDGRPLLTNLTVRYTISGTAGAGDSTKPSTAARSSRPANCR